MTVFFFVFCFFDAAGSYSSSTFALVLCCVRLLDLFQTYEGNSCCVICLVSSLYRFLTKKFSIDVILLVGDYLISRL